MTSSGPLDVLGEIGKGKFYEDLLDQNQDYLLEDGLQTRVLDHATLVEPKEVLGRDKDRAALAILRRTLEEKLKI